MFSHSLYRERRCPDKAMVGVWLLVQMPSVAYCMLRFIVRKYTGMAVDLGCWILKPPCFAVMEAIKVECSGMALFDVRDAKKWEVMSLKSEHRSLSHLFQFLG